MKQREILVVGTARTAIGTFGGKNIEMIVPEIDHELVELPLALHRTEQARLLQLVDDHARRPHHIASEAPFFSDLRRRIELEQFSAVEPDGLQRRNLLFDPVIRDFFGFELIVEIGAHSDSIHSLNGVRYGTKARPIEKVDGFLFGC